MKQSDGRDGDGGVHRGRSEDAAGGLRGLLQENSRGGDAAPTPRASATGLPAAARAPAGRPPMAPRVLERHRDADEFPRERETRKEGEEEAKPLAVRPRGAPRECSEQGRDSASRETGQRSAATALGGRGRLGHHHNAVEWPRESEPSSRESGALVVRARSTPQERPRPEGGSTSDRSAAGLQSSATAHLGRHHGGLVSPREREPRRAEGRPRWLQLEEHPCGTPSIRPEGSLGAPGKLWGFDANGVVSNDDVPQHRRGVSSPGASDSGKGRDKSNDLPARRTGAKSTHKTSTAAAVHETSAEPAPNGGGIQSLGSTEAGEGGSYDKPSSEPECSGAAASGHLHPAHGDASIPGVPAAQENAEQSEMVQGIVSELLETKSILDVEFVESWLLEKETDSTLSYFQTYASRAERTWYNQWISCLSEYMGNTSDLPHENAFKESYCDEIPEEDLDAIFCKIQDQNYKCEMNDLLKGRFIAMHSLKEFLCRSCLESEPGLEFSALGIILAAARCKSNLHALGAKIHIIGIAVVKAFTGSPKVQSQALKLLSMLCGLHANTKRILDLGGFGCAIHVLRFSALGAEPAAQLVSILLESECSYPSIFKDHLPYHLVKAVGLGRMKDPRTIEDILLLASKVELSLTGFFDALKILKPGCRTKNWLFGMLSKMASAHIEED